MPTVGDVLDVLESIAPSSMAYPWDRIGLQVGERGAKVERALVSLDSSPAAAAEAAKSGCHLMLSHHPLIWNPLKSIGSDHPGPTLCTLIRSGIAFIAAHTNWDAADGGVNDTLAQRLGLSEIHRFGSSAPLRTYKLVVFAPATETSGLIDALSVAGAGVIGEYERCAFFHEGIGTFRGSERTHPTVGQPGRIEEVAETRIEMVVPENRIRRVEQALRAAHPYEEPAYDFFPLREADQPGIGRIGHLAEPLDLGAFRAYLDDRLETRTWAWGEPGRRIGKVAVVGGAADDEWKLALDEGAHAFVTGEVKQNVAVEAEAAGLAIFAAGHYATENPGMAALRDRLAEVLPEIEWRHYEPPCGSGGRPW